MSKKIYQSITLYKDMAPQILELEKVEAGEVLQAIMRYSCYGEDTDFSQYDRFVRSLWKTIKLKLDAGETYNKEISETNRSNVMKRWEKKNSNTTEYDRIQSNEFNTTEYDRTTITDTVTGTISSTATNSSTVTKQEQTDADSVDRRSASAAAKAEPPAGDLFSVKQLISISKRNKIKLTPEGIKVFYEEMQESGWLLYDKQVEKSGIVKAMRGWAKYHPEYAPEDPKPLPKQPRKEPEPASDSKPKRTEYDPNDKVSQLAWLKEQYGENVLEESGFTEEEFFNGP
jgi:hypothetical protein